MNTLASRLLKMSVNPSPLINCTQVTKCTQFFIHSTTTPSIFSSNCLLDYLSKSGRIDQARLLFEEMPQRDEFSWTTIISAYTHCGRLTEAHQLFEQAPNHNSVTWSALISGHARHGSLTKVLGLFWQMQFQGLKPDQHTVGSVLSACSAFYALQRGEQVHAFSVKTSYDSNVYVVTGLVDMYAKCKRIYVARSLFDKMVGQKNHVLWTAIITGYSQNGDGTSSIKCFCDMRRENVSPNHFTFPSVLTACSIVSTLEFGIQVHGCIICSGLGGNVFVDSALIDMYAKCGDLDSATQVLVGMENQNVVSWNCLIVGCVNHGCEEEALSLFNKMHIKGVKIDDFTYPSVLNSLASVMDSRNGKSVHGLIVKSGFEDPMHVSNALVDMYAKNGSLDSALHVFNNLRKPDVISWTSLITGYTNHGPYEEALKLFSQMRTAGVEPDEFVIAGVLSACGGLAVSEFGQQIHVIIIRNGFKSSLSINNSLVTMYGKCGSIEDAHQAFELMPIRDLVSWTAMIVSHARNGRATVSIQLYYLMLKSGIKPDFITFVGLLFACSHAGLADEGQCYFESMHNVYGITPGPVHYACMIDLFGRAGKMKEAEDLLNRMNVKPDSTVWKALLGACRVHQNMELGERAAQNLFELEPRSAGPYVLLSNMYSAAGRKEDAARIRRLMKSRGVSKEPGCSWIEVNNKVHTFVAEDRSHLRMTEIYSKVDETMILIEEAGYAPNMNFALHDVDEECKKLGLAYHSEKLAVAFGLLTVPNGAPIRVFKNLRVCGDCHNAIKLISKVVQRHIILRDSNCFHHFKEGMCSCSDYW